MDELLKTDDRLLEEVRWISLKLPSLLLLLLFLRLVDKMSMMIHDD